MAFNPLDHVITVRSKQGKESKFINFRKATLWFHKDHPLPEGRILTERVNLDPLTFRADIYVGEWLVATAHASEEGERNTLSKIESAAIRRALANAGYDADHAIYRLAQAIPTEEAMKKLGSGGNRRMATEPEQHNAPAPELEIEPNIPGTGEIASFQIDGFTTRQSRFGKTFYALTAADSDGDIVLTFSRDLFRSRGYLEPQMKNWDKPGYKVRLKEPFAVEATWIPDEDNGGYWRAIVPEKQKPPVPEGAQDLDDWFPKRDEEQS